ncbi:MAG: DUF1801 domain-containing protein [Saprospiraceae bacterium]
MAKPASVDAYIAEKSDWEPILVQLREVLLELGFAEAIKWQMPVYMLGGKNLIGLGAFKNHFSLWFMKGHLLSDPLKVLSNAQPGKTKEMRHWKWFALDEFKIEEVHRYLEEVKAVHLAG